MREQPDSRVSKEQADKAADALIAQALAQQRREAEQITQPLVRLYPGLENVPPLERHAVLVQAREAVKGEVVPKMLLALIGLVLAAAVALAFNGQVRPAIGTCAAAIGIGILRQVVELLLVRRRLQQPR